MSGAYQVTRCAFEHKLATTPFDGLTCWASIVLNDSLQLDGLQIRRVASGKLRLFFPERRDRYGILHRYVWPLDPADRASIEAQVLADYARSEALP